MSNEKIKLYRNALRKTDNGNVVRHPYLPQYKALGLTPENCEMKSLPETVLVSKMITPDDNPRTRRVSIRQPYAEAVETTASTLGNSPIPNVGNSMEQSWSYIDNEMIDDLSGEVIGTLDENAQMIDNNDSVSIPNSPIIESPIIEAEKGFMTENDLKQELNNTNDLSSLEDNSYILIVNDNIISIGSMEHIQDQANLLIFGEHDLCDGTPIPAEDIIILKKIKIKIGLFLE